MRQSLLTITLTVLASIAAVVACGPTNEATGVRVIAKDGSRALAESCGRGLQRRLQVEVKPGTRTVALCAAEESEPTKTPSYRVVNQGLRYSVGKGDRNRLVVYLRIGVNFPEEAKKETRDHATWVLTNVCAKSLDKVWKASATGVELAVKFVDAESASADADDPQLYLADSPSAPQSAADAKPRLVNAIWPDRGELLPFGDDAERKACLAKAKTATERDQCKRQTMIDANQRFCANFVVLAGHFLGINEDEAVAGRCEDSKELRGGVAKSALQAGAEVAAGPAAVESFFKNARFTKSDVSSVIEPACAEFKLEPTPTPQPK